VRRYDDVASTSRLSPPSRRRRPRPEENFPTSDARFDDDDDRDASSPRSGTMARGLDRGLDRDDVDTPRDECDFVGGRAETPAAAHVIIAPRARSTRDDDETTTTTTTIRSTTTARSTTRGGGARARVNVPTRSRALSARVAASRRGRRARERRDTREERARLP